MVQKIIRKGEEPSLLTLFCPIPAYSGWSQVSFKSEAVVQGKALVTSKKL